MGFKVVVLLAFFGLAAAQWDPNFTPGRHTIVHLFEWRWDTIAEECERFLGPYGYGGVQVSPVTEHVIVTNPYRPWYERYQPVSYNIMTTRSGNEQDFVNMVKRCNDVGVRIYVDIVINHMSGAGMSGQGTGGSSYNGGNKQYPEYSAQDFNGPDKCPTASGDIEDYNDPIQVRNCNLVSLNDLDGGKEYVRAHIAELMNKLISMGIAGFRVDAAKHMWPADMNEIFKRLNNLNTTHGFAANSKPFIYQEVIDLSDSEPIRGEQYFDLGRVTEFRFGRELGNAFRGNNQLRWLENWGPAWGLYPDGNALVFIDNHDNQRGHGGGGSVLTFRMSRQYKMASAFMLAHPYGITRVMSSYYWEQRFEGDQDKNDWVGPPNNNGDIVPPTINPDLSCGEGWICEHRWRPIYSMVKFRNVVHGTVIGEWTDNQSNQIAFCRGDKGFIAINGDDFPMTGTFQTCLPAGRYCDIISGSKNSNSCTGTVITVGSDGKAQISLTNETDDPIIAIHVESKLDN